MKITGFHPAYKLAKKAVVALLQHTPSTDDDRRRLVTDARTIGLAVTKHPTNIPIERNRGYDSIRVSYM